MSYQHISPFERARIETLKESGCSLRDISRRIATSHASWHGTVLLMGCTSPRLHSTGMKGGAKIPTAVESGLPP